MPHVVCWCQVNPRCFQIHSDGILKSYIWIPFGNGRFSRIVRGRFPQLRRKGLERTRWKPSNLQQHPKIRKASICKSCFIQPGKPSKPGPVTSCLRSPTYRIRYGFLGWSFDVYFLGRCFFSRILTSSHNDIHGPLATATALSGWFPT